jgi:hypothetical protein
MQRLQCCRRQQLLCRFFLFFRWFIFREVSGKISFSDCSGKENAVDGCAFYYSYFNWLCMGFYTDSVKVLNPLAVEIDFGSIGKMELGYIRTALFRCAVGDSVLEAYICY